VTQSVCRVFGFASLGVGLVGLFQTHFLGMHLTPVHVAIHVVSGVLALFFGYAAPHGARGFAMSFGSIYLMLGLLGFLAPNVVARLIGHRTGVTADMLLPDNLIHLLVAGFLLGAGWASEELPSGRLRRAGR
jgi:hypothetical protein